LIVDDEMRELIFSEAPITAMRAAALNKGMILLREDGFRKASEGVTTLEEVIRVTG